MTSKVKPVANPSVAKTPEPVNVNGAFADLSSVISEMERGYQADPKFFYNERDGNARAKSMLANVKALETRLHVFIRHD